jgi:hypothetical protein
MIRQTRAEIDYLENLDNLIFQDPKAGYRIIADNLTTHCSESLVRYIAESCSIDTPLGKNGVRGILRSVKSRFEFLTDPSHRIQFMFTPRHCSWLNQIEIWFGTLRRKVTRWMRFASLDALQGSIFSFIEYYNKTLAHPYHWTYTEVSEPNKLSPASGISPAVGFQRRSTNSRLDLCLFSLGSPGARLPLGGVWCGVVWCGF